MTNAKHTPGPWEAFEERVFTVNDIQFVAEASTEANANLIAVAPDLLDENKRLREVSVDLLAACEAALKYIPGSEVHCWPPGHRLKRNALELFNVAITKATKAKGGGK